MAGETIYNSIHTGEQIDSAVAWLLKHAQDHICGGAAPGTTIETPSDPTYWFAGAGAYTCGSSTISIPDGRIGIISYDGSDWSSETFDVGKSIVYLDSMGEELDGSTVYVGPGMVIYDPDQSTIKKCTAPDVYETIGCNENVLYCNKVTNVLYRWHARSLNMIQVGAAKIKVINNLTEGGEEDSLSAEMGKVLKGLIDNMGIDGSSIIKDVTYRNGNLVFTFETSEGDKVVNVPLDIDLSEYVPVTRKVNGKALSQDITIGQSDISGLAAALAALVPQTRTINGKELSSNVTIGMDDIQGLVDAINNAGSGGGCSVDFTDGNVEFGTGGASVTGLSVTDTATGDLEFADEDGNVVLRVSDGDIKTKYFDSSRAGGDTSGKQDTLVSGVNIKTINGISLLGPGNIAISGGDSGGGSTVDTSVQLDLNLFFVGNSFSLDAMAYVPWILGDIAPNVNLKIGVAFVANGELSTHNNYMTSDSASYTYHKYVNGAWTQTSSQKMSTMLADESWDIVSFQQASAKAADYTSISNYLQSCMDSAKQTLGRLPEYWWLMGQRRTNSSYTYEVMSQTAHKVMKNFDITTILPVGTAVESARGTTLNSVGNGGGLTADGAHLQEGLPVLLAGYTVVTAILQRFELGGTVYGHDYTGPTAMANTDPNGSSTGMTAENMLIAQKCAILANKFNYRIKTIH